MIVQKEPFEAICEAQQSVMMANFPRIVRVSEGWPDTKFLETDGNLPSVFLQNLSASGTNKVSRLNVHAQVIDSDGQGWIITEQLRLEFMEQMSIFARTKEERASLGFQIQQYFATNYIVPLLPSNITIPGGMPDSTKEYMKIVYAGGKVWSGQTNYYRTDFTWLVSARILDAVKATMVSTVQIGPLDIS